MDFKYKTIFAAEGKIKAFNPEQKEKLSVASLAEISKYLPKNIDLTQNSDLLAVSFAGAVANMVNLNDDGITGANLVEIAKNFVGKLIDIDHSRRRICGHITNYAFTKFGTDEPLTEEEARSYNDRFNIVLGGLIFKLADSDLAEGILEASNPESPEHASLSASWEIGFSNNNLLLLPKGKSDYKDGIIMLESDADYEKASNSLRANGGNGVWEGFRVCRDIILPALPLGIGITANPAGAVKGIATELNRPNIVGTAEHEDSCEREDCKMEEDANCKEVIISEKVSSQWVCPHCAEDIHEKSLSGWNATKRASQHTCGGWVVHPPMSEEDKAFLSKLQGSEISEDELKAKLTEINQAELDSFVAESISTNVTKETLPELIDITGISNILSDLKKFEEFLATASKQTVMNSETLHTETNMLTSFADINEEYLKTAQANELREFLEKQVAESASKASEQLKTEKAAIEGEKAAIEGEKAALATELATIKAQYEDAKKQLDVLLKEKSEATAQDLFNKRMSYFDEKFELAKEGKVIISNDLKEVANDEVFASYQQKMDVLLKGKEKGKQAVASVAVVNEEKLVSKALDNATLEVVTVTAGVVKDEPKGLFEKYAKYFALNDENYQTR